MKKTTVRLCGFDSCVGTPLHRVFKLCCIALHWNRLFSQSLFQDVRILILEENSYYPLMRLNELANVPQPGRKLRVMGWGKQSINSMRGADILQQVNVTAEGYDVCSRLRPPTSDMMCASGFNVSGTCRGDSGGPLIMAGNDFFQDVQVGIVSFSILECVHRK